MADSNKTGARLARVATMVVLGVAATGCIVLPYGRDHGRYGRGHRHYTPPAAPVGAVIVVPDEQTFPGRRR